MSRKIGATLLFRRVHPRSIYNRVIVSIYYIPYSVDDLWRNRAQSSHDLCTRGAGNNIIWNTSSRGGRRTRITLEKRRRDILYCITNRTRVTVYARPLAEGLMNSVVKKLSSPFVTRDAWLPVRARTRKFVEKIFSDARSCAFIKCKVIYERDIICDMYLVC